MTGADIMADAFSRVHDMVHGALDALPDEHLSARIDADANSIAWLVWHLARVQDDHVAEVAGTAQQWMSSGWAQRFALPFATEDIGYGHSSEQVALVTAEASLLRDYFDAVHAQTVAFVLGCADADWDRVVDERWTPPVTLGVRMVSVLTDSFAHAGQAAYVRGVLERT